MGGYKRLFAIVFVLTATSVAWLVLAGITTARKDDSGQRLKGDVEQLWGRAQVQQAVSLGFEWQEPRLVTRTETVDGKETEVREVEQVDRTAAVAPAATEVGVALSSDLRRRGLVWHSLYDVDFDARWRYVHRREQAGELRVELPLPDPEGTYDAFVFTVAGRDHAAGFDPEAGKLVARHPVAPGDDVEIHVHYRSRGLDTWHYRPSEGVGRLERFGLKLTTDFADIDFPADTLSPTARKRRGDGWVLEWRFAQLVSGRGIGMVTPTRVQPGELAAALSASAPVSLFFFFLVLYVFATLRGIDVHPINYALLAGAFFAFHLLFAYSVDHLSVEVAFTLASVVSIVLVVSYLRLVVSPRFALREAGLAQLVYLVGFSLAHFWQGYTGLTVTVLAIVTLFLLMQLTGRIRWSEVVG